MVEIKEVASDSTNSENATSNEGRVVRQLNGEVRQNFITDSSN